MGACGCHCGAARVEFADESVIEYDRTAAHSLTEHLKRHPNLVFEGHSTDYQPRQCLRKMVEDGSPFSRSDQL